MRPELEDVDAHPFGPAEFREAMEASASAMADIEHFLDLLTTWGQRFNLVGPSALSQFWRRHAFDSAQLLKFTQDEKLWADIGAGAGFPGVVLAVMLKRDPKAEVHLIDSMAKRTRFLSEVVRELSLPAVVHTARAENLTLPCRVGVVTSRACAPLSKLLTFAAPNLRSTTLGLFLKGRNAEAELLDAGQGWRFRSKIYNSLSDPSGRIIQIQDLHRA